MRLFVWWPCVALIMAISTPSFAQNRSVARTGVVACSTARSVALRTGTTPCATRALYAQIDSLHVEIEQASAASRVPSGTLRAIALELGARNPNLTRSQFVDLIRTRAQDAATAQARIAELTAAVAALDPGGERSRALALLAQANAAVDEGRLEDAGVALTELRFLRNLQSEAAQSAWEDSVVASIDLATLRGDLQLAQALADDFQSEVERRAYHSIWSVRFALAEGWADQAFIEDGDSAALTAIGLYRAILSSPNIGDMAQHDRVNTQNSLGVALLRLGEREVDNVHLNEAESAFRSALSEIPDDSEAIGRANVQAYLARTLLKLGERSENLDKLNESLRLFNSVISVLLPIDGLAWQESSIDRSIAMREIGIFTEDASQIQDSVREFRFLSSFMADTRLALPRARVQSHHALSLNELGYMHGNEAMIAESEMIINQSLQIQTQAVGPSDWATSQFFLGVMMTRRGVLESGTTHLYQAVDAFNNALLVSTRSRAPHDWAAAQHKLAESWRLIGGRESGTVALNTAIMAYQLALQERTLAKQPLEWAHTAVGLAAAKALLAERQHDPLLLDESERLTNDARAVALSGGNRSIVEFADQLLIGIAQSRQAAN